jgi:hypothetical protein
MERYVTPAHSRSSGAADRSTRLPDSPPLRRTGAAGEQERVATHPASGAAAATRPSDTSGSPRCGVKDADAIIEMLRSGHTDMRIARSLGITERTVRRRIALLMTEVGARSRFQFGALVGSGRH